MENQQTAQPNAEQKRTNNELSYLVTVNNKGGIRITDSESDFADYQIPIHQSLLEALWNIICNEEMHCAPITIVYNSCTYEWCHTYSHYCFAKGRMSVDDFAQTILVLPQPVKLSEVE